MFELTSSANTFSEFRLIYGAMLAILLIYFMISLIAGGRVGSFSLSHIVQVSIIQGVMALVLFFVEKNVVDEYLVEPDQIAFYLFLAILVFCILNPIAYYIRQRSSVRRGRYQYRF